MIFRMMRHQVLSSLAVAMCEKRWEVLLPAACRHPESNLCENFNCDTFYYVASSFYASVSPCIWRRKSLVKWFTRNGRSEISEGDTRRPNAIGIWNGRMYGKVRCAFVVHRVCALWVDLFYDICRNCRQVHTRSKYLFSCTRNWFY